MDKKLVFKWVSFISDNEEYAGRYADIKLAISFVPTKVNLAKTVEIASYVGETEEVKATLGQYYSHVSISGLTEPIELTTSFDVGDYNNGYTVADRGPTVQWLLENKEALVTADPNKVLYVGSMAIQITPYTGNEDAVCITILNTEDMDDFLLMVEGSRVEWLGDKTFDAFLESYGYTNEAVVRDITAIVMVYQAARELGFKDPKSIATHFFDSRLVADLTLRGAFEGLKESL